MQDRERRHCSIFFFTAVALTIDVYKFSKGFHLFMKSNYRFVMEGTSPFLASKTNPAKQDAGSAAEWDCCPCASSSEALRVIHCTLLQQIPHIVQKNAFFWCCLRGISMTSAKQGKRAWEASNYIGFVRSNKPAGRGWLAPNRNWGSTRGFLWIKQTRWNQISHTDGKLMDNKVINVNTCASTFYSSIGTSV